MARLATAALEDFDARVRSRAARCGARRSSLPASRAAGGRRLLKSSRALLGQPQRQAAAIVRVGRALDQPGANQGVDRAADRRRAAPDGRGDLVERRRLVRCDRGQQLAPRALRTFGAGRPPTQFWTTAVKRAARAAATIPTT